MRTKRTITLAVAVVGVSALTAPSVVAKSNGTLLGASRFVTAQKQDPKIETFTGTIAKKGDQFILTDNSSKFSYSLDDQQTAEKFAGKKVRVKGILDAVNNTIRIQAIEIAPA